MTKYINIGMWSDQLALFIFLYRTSKIVVHLIHTWQDINTLKLLAYWSHAALLEPASEYYFYISSESTTIPSLYIIIQEPYFTTQFNTL